MFDSTAPHLVGTFVLVVGPHSSGKSTFASELAASNGGTVVELGDVVREEARWRQRDNLVELAAELLDADALFVARLAARQAHKADNGLVVVVGPRTVEEFHYLCRELPLVLTVGMTVSTSLRRFRWAARDIGFADTWEERERLERRWGTSELVGMCQLTVDASMSPSTNAEMVAFSISGERNG